MAAEPKQPIDKEHLLTQKILPYQYFEQTYIRKIHHFYLSSTIEEPIKYIDMIHQIKIALPEDIIHIHLNIQGGNLSTGIQIVNALNATEAHIICSLEAEAHSLGTLIFLSANEFIVHDNCTMLFHNFSGGIFGKGNEQVAELGATIKWFTELSRQIYVPFLSEDELQSILKGEDLWLHSKEISTRLEKMIKALKKQINADAKEDKKFKKTSNTLPITKKDTI